MFETPVTLSVMTKPDICHTVEKKSVTLRMFSTEKFNQKLFLWRKMTNIRYANDLYPFEAGSWKLPLYQKLPPFPLFKKALTHFITCLNFAFFACQVGKI